MSPASPDIFIPVFGGLEGCPIDPSQACSLITHSPTLQVILATCLEAFHAEFATLEPSQLDRLQVRLEDFSNEETLLNLPSAPYTQNAALLLPRHLLLQCIYYFHFVETRRIRGQPFDGLLKTNADLGVGILSFCSGVLTAAVVATSRTPIDFMGNLREVYRLSIWLGIRSQLSNLRALQTPPIVEDSSPFQWSTILLGSSKDQVAELVRLFNLVGYSFLLWPYTYANPKNRSTTIYLTSILDDRCVGVSALPQDLASFVESLPKAVHCHKTTTPGLYHVPAYEATIKRDILLDIAARKISLPTSSDLVVPFRHTYTGDLVSANSDISLDEALVDMFLLQRVNWDLIVVKAIDTLPPDPRIHLVDLGIPLLLEALENRLPRVRVDIHEAFSPDDHQLSFKTGLKQEPVAIIGMAVDMPGAPNTETLWSLLINGISTVQEIPKDRFDHTLFTDGKARNRSMKARMGNFVNDVDGFDNRFFSVSPREARSMDPQQRLLLHVAQAALDDAGYVPNSTPSFDPSTFGCFIGSATHDYSQNLRSDIDTYYISGTLKSFLAGRLSRYFGFSGPSLVVDTACSSSAVALYQASRSLNARDCNAALVGGVNVISSPDIFIGLDKGRFLSPRGQCRPFDESADGYCRAEGCGVFVLKRLTDAIKDNDRILGVIRSVEVNQSGHSSSITRPHESTQEALLQRVLASSGVEPVQVSLVEAHGTGTQVGDLSELRSLRKVLAVHRTSGNPLHITSIKANIGHLEAASACASLAKVILMLREKVIPRQISFYQLNSHLAPLEVDNLSIATENIPWRSESASQGRYQPLLSLISNFGASGSNVAILVEEFVPLNVSSHYRPPYQPPFYVFGLSAKTPTALSELRDRYQKWLQRPDFTKEISIPDLAYTSTARRQLYDYRLAFSVSSKDELMAKLGGSTPFVRVPKEPCPIVFVFSGQGTHYRGMGSSLHKTSPIFRRHVAECQQLLSACGFPGVLTAITDDVGDSPLGGADATNTQVATFVLEYALAALWLHLGVRPVAVVGHSLGEYTALVTAGVLALKDAIKVIATRECLMHPRCGPSATGMLAVRIQGAKLESLLKSNQGFSQLSVSCFNSPQDSVISGPIADLQEFKRFLHVKMNTKSTFLNVPHAFHSPAMDPILPDLRKLSGALKLHPPSIPVVSTTRGRLVLPGDQSSFTNDYFVRHCAEPVRFEEGINSLLASGICLSTTEWLEIGPHPAVTPLLKSFPSISTATTLCSLRNQKDAWHSLSDTLAVLYLGNHRIDWRLLFAEMGSQRCVSLPPYPLQSTKFWVPYDEPDLIVPRIAPLETTSIFLESWTVKPSTENGNLSMFRTTLDRLHPFITGHQVSGIALCPASVYLECAVAGVISSLAAVALDPHGFHVELRHIEYPTPLVWDANTQSGSTRAMTTAIEPDNGTFVMAACLDASHSQIPNARGHYLVKPVVEISSAFADLRPSLDVRIAHVLEPGAGADSFSTKMIYDAIFPRIVRYAERFQTIRSLTLRRNEAVAHLHPLLLTPQKFALDPVVIDSILHAAGFVVNLDSGPENMFVCYKLGSFTMLPEMLHDTIPYLIFCATTRLPGGTVVRADCYLMADTRPRIIVSSMVDIHFKLVHLDRFRKSLTSSWNIQPTTHRHLSPPPSTLHLPYGFNRASRRMSLDPTVPTIRSSSPQAGVGSECPIGPNTPRPEGVIGSSHSSPLPQIPSIPSFDCPYPTILPYTPPSECHVVPREETGLPLLRRALSKVLGLDEHSLSDDVELATLGLDSFGSMEVLHLLRPLFHGLLLPASLFETGGTLRQLAAHLTSQTQAKSGNAYDLPSQPAVGDFQIEPRLQTQRPRGLSQVNCVYPIHAGAQSNDMVPLVLVHDGSGLISSYQRLPPDGRSVWGIANPRLLEPDTWKSITEMATCYASHIGLFLKGPLVLGGWSFGGVVAVEVARILANERNTTNPVKGIVLIDSPSPDNRTPLPVNVVDYVVDHRTGDLDSTTRASIKAQFLNSGRLLHSYDPSSTTDETERMPMVYLRCTQPFRIPSSDIQAPTWLTNPMDPSSPGRGWERYAQGSLNVLDVQTDHFEVFDLDKVAQVSLQLSRACDILDPAQ